jgi:hypothetical protein
MMTSALDTLIDRLNLQGGKMTVIRPSLTPWGLFLLSPVFFAVSFFRALQSLLLTNRIVKTLGKVDKTLDYKDCTKCHDSCFPRLRDDTGKLRDGAYMLYAAMKKAAVPAFILSMYASMIEEIEDRFEDYTFAADKDFKILVANIESAALSGRLQPTPNWKEHLRSL